MSGALSDKKMNDLNVDVVIPAYKPDGRFIRLIERLGAQSVKINRIIVINTEKSGWDALLSKHPGKLPTYLDVEHISKKDFDHAASRNRGVKKSTADFVLIMTMDALPVGRDLVDRLLVPFSDEKVAVSFARQLPEKGATAVERLSRSFNYPENSVIKSMADVDRLGIKTFFCSNVCAMYRRSIFDMVGGFSEPAIFNEDMVFAHAAMQKGFKVAYCGDARVCHSHNYSGLMQLKRNFDNGVSQAMHPEVFASVSSEKEGLRMLSDSCKSLIKSGHPLSVLALIWQSGCKYLGFFMGKRYRYLPGALVRAVSLNRNFWDHI